MLSMMRRGFYPEEVVCGKGSSIRLRFIESQNAVLVVGKSSLRESGQLDALIAVLGNVTENVTVLEGYSGDPSESSIMELAGELARIKPDVVIAAGGGATLDTAKLARLLYENTDKKLEDFSRAFSLTKPAELRLVAVPTTAGSGSESSIAAVYTSVSGTKQPVVSEHLLPNLAVLDSVLTDSMSPQQTLSSGLDNFTHAFESYCSPIANPMSKALAATAGRLVAANLRESVANPQNQVARENVMIGAYYGGIAQSITSTGVVHAVAHAIGELYGINHGRAIAALLPGGIRMIAENSEIAQEFTTEIGAGSPEETAEWIEQTSSDLGLPSMIDEQINVAEVIARSKLDVCMRTAPFRPSDEDLISLLEPFSN